MHRAAIGLVVVLTACVSSAVPVSADTINVPADQPTIQIAIISAAHGDEIVVAPGVYPEIINLSGKAITLRSSDGPAVTTIDATGVIDIGAGKPVVRCDSGEGANTIIDGFTFTGGTGDTTTFGAPIGGGVFINNASPTVRNCIFTDLTDSASGGGLTVVNAGSEPLIVDCTFQNNAVIGSGGGAMSIFNGAAPTVERCMFHSNQSVSGGGAVIGQGAGAARLIGCTFFNNTATGASANGGGLFWEAALVPTPLTLANCLFTGNHADLGGGAAIGGEANIVNCVFSGNTAEFGAGLRAGFDADLHIVNATFVRNTASVTGGGVHAQNADIDVANSIFWSNAPDQLFSQNGAATVDRSLVDGGWFGPGADNFDADPMFFDGDGADDTFGTLDDNLRPAPGSPCIDRADLNLYAARGGPFDAADGAPRVFDDADTVDSGVGTPTYLDVGAYEFIAFTSGPTGACCVGDACAIVSATACSALGGQYQGDATICETANCPAFCAADIAGPNGPGPDGVVDTFDLLELLAAWGRCLP